jgi:hypothetical protein
MVYSDIRIIELEGLFTFDDRIIFSPNELEKPGD